MEFKVLTYNIHKGFPVFQRRLVLSEIRDAIESTHCDLVFLQEVVGQNDFYSSSLENWPIESQFEYLADRMWRHHAYGKNAVYPKRLIFSSSWHGGWEGLLIRIVLHIKLVNLINNTAL